MLCCENPELADLQLTGIGNPHQHGFDLEIYHIVV
jgi:hypothetical protein